MRGIRGDHTEPDVRAVSSPRRCSGCAAITAPSPTVRCSAASPIRMWEAVPAALQDELADNPHVDGLVQVVTSTGDRGAGVQDCVGVVPLRIMAMRSCC